MNRQLPKLKLALYRVCNTGRVSPQAFRLQKNIEKAQRNALNWINFLNKRDSVTECMSDNGKPPLLLRRAELDTHFIGEVEAWEFKAGLTKFTRCTHNYNTHGRSISCQHYVTP